MLFNQLHDSITRFLCLSLGLSIHLFTPSQYYSNWITQITKITQTKKIFHDGRQANIPPWLIVLAFCYIQIDDFTGTKKFQENSPNPVGEWLCRSLHHPYREMSQTTKCGWFANKSPKIGRTRPILTSVGHSELWFHETFTNPGLFTCWKKSK